VILYILLRATSHTLPTYHASNKSSNVWKSEEATGRPRAAHTKSGRMSKSPQNEEFEPIKSELHIIRYRWIFI